MNNEFEVSPLTRIPGGFMIELEYQNGESSRGVNIKHLRKYLDKVITESFLNGNGLVRAKLSSSKQTIYESGKFYGVADRK